MAGKRDHRETEGVIGRLKKTPLVLENPSEAALFQPDPAKKYAACDHHFSQTQS